MHNTTRKAIALSLLFLVCGGFAAGSNSSLTATVCSVMLAIQDTLMTIAPTLVLLMFVYGGVKYVFSADDPGGRKQGKMTCIHAVIGGIIVIVAVWVVRMIGFSTSCST